MAEFERVETIFLGHPFALAHKLAVDQRDLARRSAKAEQADAGERPQQIDKSDGTGESR